MSSTIPFQALRKGKVSLRAWEVDLTTTLYWLVSVFGESVRMCDYQVLGNGLDVKVQFILNSRQKSEAVFHFYPLDGSEANHFVLKWVDFPVLWKNHDSKEVVRLSFVDRAEQGQILELAFTDAVSRLQILGRKTYPQVLSCPHLALGSIAEDVANDPRMLPIIYPFLHHYDASGHRFRLAFNILGHKKFQGIVMSVLGDSSLQRFSVNYLFAVPHYGPADTMSLIGGGWKVTGTEPRSSIFPQK